MINLNRYNLTDAENETLANLMRDSQGEIDLNGLWLLMNSDWDSCGCSQQNYNDEQYANFYRYPVWLLNGIFIESDQESTSHRNAIVASIRELSPRRVVGFGGGYGTLARLLAAVIPNAEVHICEPHPPRHGVESCKPYPGIRFVPSLVRDTYDVLVSTDVLEHVHDPLALFAEMIASVNAGGHLIIANCFYPVIKCHLPSTLHLRTSFDRFSQELGLDVVGPCPGSHATIYRRVRVIEPDWQRIRALESQSKRSFARHQFKARYITSWSARLRYGITNPVHYLNRLRGRSGPSVP
jgi:hypothetical protein